MAWSSMSGKLAWATRGPAFFMAPGSSSLTGLCAGPLGPANVSLKIGPDDLMKSRQLCLNNYLTLGYI